MTAEVIAPLITLVVGLVGLLGVSLATGWVSEAWDAIVEFIARLLPPYRRAVEESVTSARPRITDADQAQAIREASKRFRNRRRFDDWQAEFDKLAPPPPPEPYVPPPIPDECECDHAEIRGWSGLLDRKRLLMADCPVHEEEFRAELHAYRRRERERREKRLAYESSRHDRTEPS